MDLCVIQVTGRDKNTRAMAIINLSVLLLLWMFMQVSVKADFNFTVRFYEYWNPTGLCAECGTNGVPVCCDDPQRTESCNNTGVLRCDTRFRFIQRPFNAPLETAPNMDDEFPNISGHTNENHDIFSTEAGGWFRMVNPVTRTNTSSWTGKIQFLVDTFDRINNNQAPNETEGIVDRFVINLDQLQLGADLTEQTTYTGIYNISQLAMSFRVDCSEKYYGSDCTTFCEAVEGVYNCDSDGNIVCVEKNRDPSTSCTQRLSTPKQNTGPDGYIKDHSGKCEIECMQTSPALVGGVVVGVACLIILLSTLTIFMVVYKRHRTKSDNKNTGDHIPTQQPSADPGPNTYTLSKTIELSINESYGVSTENLTEDNDTYRVNDDEDRDSTPPQYEPVEYDYVSDNENENTGVHVPTQQPSVDPGPNTHTLSKTIELSINESYGVSTENLTNNEDTYYVNDDEDRDSTPPQYKPVEYDYDSQ